MSIRLLTISILLVLSATMHAQVDWRIGTPVEIYEVRSLDATPALDGKLDDAAWEGVRATDQFYDYMAPTKIGSFPPLATIRTVMRIGSTVKGLWMGFDCYAQMDKVKADIVARDNGDIWTEPCIELYVGEDWREVSFRKFIVNVLGTQTDLRKYRGVLNEQWNDMNWRVATHRHEDRWSAELFFPWSSLGGKPEKGAMLPLGVTRFSWTTGRIVGACWGAAMSNPYIYRSGQLLIEEDLTDKITQLARRQERWRGDTWHLWVDDRMITITTLDAELERVRHDAEGILADISFLAAENPLSDPVDTELRKLRETFAKVLQDAPTRNTWAATARLVEKLRHFRDRLRLQQVVTDTR